MLSLTMSFIILVEISIFRNILADAFIHKYFIVYLVRIDRSFSKQKCLAVMGPFYLYHDFTGTAGPWSFILQIGCA